MIASTGVTRHTYQRQARYLTGTNINLMPIPAASQMPGSEG